jgi:ribonucleoside-diphosphate reductase alpha chain
MGRLVSLCLRVPSGLTEKERLAEVAEQLRGIGGARQLGFGKQRVLSLPDGLGQVLEDYLGGVAQVEQKEEKVQVGDLCPECGQATFVYTEGCHKCYSCGHSEC